MIYKFFKSVIYGTSREDIKENKLNNIVYNFMAISISHLLS